MDARERFFATIRNEAVDRPASWLGLPTATAMHGLFKHFGAATEYELKQIIDDDVWPVRVPYHNPPYFDIGCSLNFGKLGPGGAQDERTLTAPGFFEDYDDPADIGKFDWPDPSRLIDREESLKRVKEVPADKVSMAFMWSAHFQDACAAFGMEHALTVAMMNPDMFRAVIDRITDFYLEAGEIFYESVKGELDVVVIGNDFGSQEAMLVSPDFLRDLVFPGTQRLIDQARSYGLTVMHHSCGSVYPVIGELFDMGADIIHPVQALARDMSAEKLSEEFRGKGAFCGGVDAQRLLVRGTPDQVMERVEELIGLFPSGLVISPSHEAILPDVPPRNIEAMFKPLQN
jgi:uroporphyrinogen decarboxylase